MSLGSGAIERRNTFVERLDAAFDRVANTVTTSADLRTILRSYLESALEDDTTMWVASRSGRPVYAQLAYDGAPLEADLEVAGLCLSDAQEAPPRSATSSPSRAPWRGC